MWNNTVEPDRPQTIRWTHITCWIPKATNTHSEHVIIMTFSLQQKMHQRASMTPSHTYVNYSVCEASLRNGEYYRLLFTNIFVPKEFI